MLITTLVDFWPRLAWCAHCRVGDTTVRLRHGGGLDVMPEFACEAVWDGPFQSGEFDKTDNVFGSGLRCRGAHTLFVTSLGTLDRIVSITLGEDAFVSNSLPCLLAVIDAQLDPDVEDYPELLESVVEGLGHYRDLIPTNRGPVQLTYHHNLVWDGCTLSESPKPWPKREFGDFAAYRGFLDATLSAFASNLADPARAVRRKFLGTMSSGYDSTTISTLARPHGLEEVISFASARGGDSDSGAVVAEKLGLRVSTFPRNAFRSIPFAEVPFLASDAKGEDVFFAAAGDLLRDHVLLTGYHGDMMWGCETKLPLVDYIYRNGGQSGLSHAEARLHLGYLHAPIALLGVRDIAQVHAITAREEMRAWDLGGIYNRPICRRIVEGAGVPREAFGQSKKAASVLFGFGFNDLSEAGRADFERWRREHASRRIRDAVIRNLARVRGRAARLRLGAKVCRALEGDYGRPRMLPIVGGLIDDVRRCSYGLDHRNLLFLWATHRITRRYQDASQSPGLAA